MLPKLAQPAVGIPSRAVTTPPPMVSKPKIWQFVRHDHDARVAGKHYDLRLGDPRTGTTYNWAGKRWPEPGQGTYVAMQPTHSYDYLKFQGRIAEGYGAGDVRIGRREPTEIISASPEEVRFNLYKGRVPEQYVLKKMEGAKWVLRNATPSRDTKTWQALVPVDKPKYRQRTSEWIDFGDEDQILQAKIDGAHAIYALRAGKPVKVFSYRVAKSTPTRLIEHTYKIPGWEKNVVPPELDNTVLRGEVYATRRGRALREKDIGALLNTSTLQSREKQHRIGGLKTSTFDVVKYKGKDVSGLPYQERLRILREVTKKIPGLHLPPSAESSKDKQRLFRRIESGREKLTREGVVAWSKSKDEVTKIKLRPDYDVHVRKVMPSTHEGWAGGVAYSLTPQGDIVGTMGSGFTHALREAMLKTPKNYVGRVARVEADEQFPSGALRVPVFKGWHSSKSEETMFKESALYHYAPKDADVLKEGLRTPYSLAKDQPSRFKFYASKAKTVSGKREATAEDIISYLEKNRGEGGSRMVSVLATPISKALLKGNPRRKDLSSFAAGSTLYSVDYSRLISKGLVDKAFLVRGGSQKAVDPKKLERLLAAAKPLKLKKHPYAFSAVPHGFIVVKKGVIPPKYLSKESQEHAIWARRRVKTARELLAPISGP